MEDDDIKALVKRLSRSHRSGGRTVERAAILAESGDASEVIAWIERHGGVPEEAVARKGSGGLHAARTGSSDTSRTATPLRWVVPADAFSAA